MFLRIILMGAVGCLGLDATSSWGLSFGSLEGPKSCRVHAKVCGAPDTVTVVMATDQPIVPIEAIDSVIEPSPTWLEVFESRVAAIETDSMPSGIDAFARVETTDAESPDTAFEAIVADQVAAFQIDRAETSEAVVKNPATGESETVGESFEDEANPIWALVLSPEVDAPGAELPLLAPAEPKSTRLAAAVELTGKALSAWLSVLHAPSVAVNPDRVARNR